MNVGSSGQVCELVRCYDVRPERECIRLASVFAKLWHDCVKAVSAYVGGVEHKLVIRWL